VLVSESLLPLRERDGLSDRRYINGLGLLYATSLPGSDRH
jgi:hypothetical protein